MGTKGTIGKGANLTKDRHEEIFGKKKKEEPVKIIQKPNSKYK